MSAAEFCLPGIPFPVALITGAARRIGAASARALAEDGWSVVLHCNRSVADARALSTELAAIHDRPMPVVQADLAAPDAADRIFAGLDRMPSLLVNNASLFEEDQIDNFAPDRWERQMAVNLRAPALLMQAFARRLPPDSEGLIVNMLDAKLAAPNPDYFSYTISKYGLAGATELAARALAPRIRVNAIAPSVTLVSGPQSRENFAAAHRMNALRRGVDVADLVRALRYLVATPTVTGQTLTLDGGQRFLGLPRDVAYLVQSL
jgi:NAD(P)-dependent dehydrogenase (short-subunit alcohol dehydrogenase family)